MLLSGDSRVGALQDDSVKILSIRRARGLQFRIVLLLWADLLGPRVENGEDESERGLLYVATTRAEDMLVILHSARSAYVDEIYRAVGERRPSLASGD